MIKYENKPIEFLLNVDESTPSLLVGDEVRIKQILNNLLSNAFKYTTSGEVELSISTESLPQDSSDRIMLVINVRDTGQGMTEEQVGKLFDDYSRFNLESNKDIEGTGLGMSILKNLINMMDGEITANSESGIGTVFTVRLPQGIAGNEIIGKEGAEKLRQFRINYDEKTKKTHIVRELIYPGKILIVDDVDINLFVAKEMLLPYGLEIDLAASGAEAIEKVKSGNYDLIFMDHIMPLMTGIQTTFQIRKWEELESVAGNPRKRITIVALTANAISGVKEMFIDNGFDDFISKPIDLHQLDEILKKWMPPGVVQS